MGAVQAAGEALAEAVGAGVRAALEAAAVVWVAGAVVTSVGVLISLRGAWWAPLVTLAVAVVTVVLVAAVLAFQRGLATATTTATGRARIGSRLLDVVRERADASEVALPAAGLSREDVETRVHESARALQDRWARRGLRGALLRTVVRQVEERVLEELAVVPAGHPVDEDALSLVAARVDGLVATGVGSTVRQTTRFWAAVLVVVPLGLGLLMTQT